MFTKHDVSDDETVENYKILKSFNILSYNFPLKDLLFWLDYHKK